MEREAWQRHGLSSTEVVRLCGIEFQCNITIGVCYIIYHIKTYDKLIPNLLSHVLIAKCKIKIYGYNLWLLTIYI